MGERGLALKTAKPNHAVTPHHCWQAEESYIKENFADLEFFQVGRLIVSSGIERKMDHYGCCGSLHRGCMCDYYWT